MEKGNVLIIGSGHLAYRIRNAVKLGGYTSTYLARNAFVLEHSDGSLFETISATLGKLDLDSFHFVYLVDEQDERNLELLIALISIRKDIPIAAALFNEKIASHLRAAHPNITILNPARIAAPTFIDALYVSREHAARYTPVKLEDGHKVRQTDRLLSLLVLSFVVVIFAAGAYFHFFNQLSWLDSFYFVVVTVATVGYGDINLLTASVLSKVIDILLILSSTFFIWMIFSLTVDRIVKRREQLALGRKQYSYEGHVIVCGLGRLSYFVVEGLLERGEKVVIIELSETLANVEYFRNRGVDVYIGNARVPQVLQDVGVERAKAVFSLVGNDFVNLEVGLNARSLVPNMRLVLRIFDDAMSQKIRENLDIYLSYSMTAIADERFFQLLESKK